MGLKLLKEYVKERYGHEVVEVPGGFAVYGYQDYNGEKIIYVQDFFVSKEQRGFSGKASNRHLFNKLKKIALKDKCTGIAGQIQLDTLNGQEMLKLFLYLGFKVIRGDGNGLLIIYEVKDGRKSIHNRS
jgi:hypothetical protein